MLIKLNDKLTNKMISFPESRMGSQDVIVTLKNGTKINAVVLNSNILLVDDKHKITSNDIHDINIK